MFSRTTPECDGPAPEHDPLHLRIATAVVVLGLIATGVTVIWRDVAGHSGDLVPQTASPRTVSPQAASPGALGQPSAARARAGLKLLSEAATACQHVSYRGVQRTAWQGPGGSWISLVNVWHQQDHQTVIQAATMPAAALPLPGAGSTGPDGDGDDDVGQRDPEGIMTLTSRMVPLLAENYRVFLAGRGQVAGRPVRELVLRHLDGRLAARFWLDNLTKLPLRRETFDGRAKMVSDDVFVSLKLGSPTVTAVPRTASAPGGKPLAGVQLARLRAAGWPLPVRLPGQLTLLRASETGGPSDAVVDLAYSDGGLALRPARSSARPAERMVRGRPAR
jgi:hypothetical protein